MVMSMLKDARAGGAKKGVSPKFSESLRRLSAMVVTRFLWTRLVVAEIRLRDPLQIVCFVPAT